MQDTEGQEVPEKVSRLAINMEGGFTTNKQEEWEETRRIVVWPSLEALELTHPDLPLQVRYSIKAAASSRINIFHQGVSYQKRHESFAPPPLPMSQRFINFI